MRTFIFLFLIFFTVSMHASAGNQNDHLYPFPTEEVQQAFTELGLTSCQSYRLAEAKVLFDHLEDLFPSLSTKQLNELKKHLKNHSRASQTSNRKGQNYRLDYSLLMALKDIASRRSQAKILDLGCGDAFAGFLFSLHSTESEITALDLDPEFGVMGGKFLTNKVLYDAMGSVRKIADDIINFEGSSYDRNYDHIYARKSLHFVDPYDQIRLIRKLYSHLNDGGTLIITQNTWTCYHPDFPKFYEEQKNRGISFPSFAVEVLKENHEVSFLPMEEKMTFHKFIKTATDKRRAIFYIDLESLKQILKAAGVPERHIMGYWIESDHDIFPAQDFNYADHRLNEVFDLVVKITKKV